MKRKSGWLFIILVVAAVLRLWRLGSVPVSLFGDELDVGYQAYSVLKTGRDYYGNRWPMHFHSLAEWRTPLYLYSAVPTVALFGISAWGVRLPAAVFGILGVGVMYLWARKVFGDERLALAAAFVLAISPWHIQYSRAAFEVTELLFFLLLGLLLFAKALEDGKYLWMAMVSLALMPWVYSTAKLFLPMLLVVLGVLWMGDLVKMSRKHLVWAAVALTVVGGPIAYSTIAGGGAERFAYISVFTNPSTEHEVGVARLNDARMRGEMGEGLSPTLLDRAFHNKYTFWGENLVANYLMAFSTDFLFVNGDPNLRHSTEGMGEFYGVDILVLLIGLVGFFGAKMEWRKKVVVMAWLALGVIPAAMTRDGGNHATRLILILPALVLLVGYGIRKLRWYLVPIYGALLLANVVFYQHGYWMHYPWYSERWWHSGFGESVQFIKEVEAGYDKVVISTASEPPWVFFAAWYEYPPQEWQAEFPVGNDVELSGFGKVSHIGKFYFGSPDVDSFYTWPEVIDSKTLYLASEKEVKVNLIAEPERVPDGLLLIKAVAYPSGEPVFYLFSGQDDEER